MFWYVELDVIFNNETGEMYDANTGELYPDCSIDYSRSGKDEYAFAASIVDNGFFTFRRMVTAVKDGETAYSYNNYHKNKVIFYDRESDENGCRNTLLGVVEFFVGDLCVPVDAPAKTGYRFAGWVTGLGKKVDFSVAFADDLTVFTSWEKEGEQNKEDKENQTEQDAEGKQKQGDSGKKNSGEKSSTKKNSTRKNSTKKNSTKKNCVITSISGKQINKSDLSDGNVSFSLKAKSASGNKLSFKLISGPKNMKKYLKVSKAGVVTVKKNAKKGVYRIKITAKDSKGRVKAEKVVVVTVGKKK